MYLKFWKSKKWFAIDMIGSLALIFLFIGKAVYDDRKY